MNKVQSAAITPVLAAGSVASPYYYQVNITQRLCFKTCVNNTPVFTPQYSVESTALVGTNQYAVTIRVQGIISYLPCDGSCCTKQQPINQTFTIPVYSTTAPTSVTITQGATVNNVAAVDCQKCTRTFVSETPLSIAVATT